MAEQMAARGWTAAELHRQSKVSYDVINKLKRRPNSSTSAENAAKLIAAFEGRTYGGPASPSAESATLETLKLGRDGYAEIPRYDANLAAGAGSWNVDEQTPVDLILFTWEFMEKYIRRTQTDGLLMLTVSGDSMSPTIADNDLVMVDTNEVNLDAGVFAFVLDGVARVKRFNVTMRGIDILSDNPTYCPEHYTREELSEIQVIGRVRWVGRAL